MANPTATEAGIREGIRVQTMQMPIDKIIGQPTTTTVNHLNQQIAKIAAAVKTTEWGGRHGHLALVIDNASYQLVTGVQILANGHANNTDRQVAPPLVPAGITATTTKIVKETIDRKHALAQQEFWKQEALDAVIVERITQEIVDSTYVEELEDEFIGYSTQTIKTLIQHLKNEWCVVSTLEKKQALDAFNFEWDVTSHITKYARELDKQQKLCRDIGVPASDIAKTQTYLENMWASEMFDDKEMRAWENLPTADKTWANAKTYFVTHYKSKKKYDEERETRAGGFESANSISQRSRATTTASTVDRGERPPSSIITSRMSTADQQTMIEYTNSLESALEEAKEHAATMTTTQENLLARIDKQQQTMMEQNTKFMKMMADLATNNKKGEHDTRTERKTSNRGGANRVDPHYCKECKKEEQVHTEENCWSNPKNKDSRPKWYKDNK